MSEIDSILLKLQGTREMDILSRMEEAYSNVSAAQSVWYEKSQFFCSEGCGECCRNFEPDLLEGEALYMAAWLMQNNPDLAQKVAQEDFPFPANRGCQFWDENQDYHCTIYGGRPLICRLFGASGSKDKNGKVIFKPCKFYPAEELSKWKVPLSHRQYNQEEIKSIFGTLPPVMSDLMEEAVLITPERQETTLIHKILPETIRRLQWIISMNSSN